MGDALGSIAAILPSWTTIRVLRSTPPAPSSAVPTAITIRGDCAVSTTIDATTARPAVTLEATRLITVCPRVKGKRVSRFWLQALDLDRGAVAKHLGHALHELCRVVPDTDDGVGAVLLRVLQH